MTAYNESSIKLLLSEDAARKKVKQSTKRYYVYLIYGRTLGVIYVGKGTRNRFLSHSAQAQKFLDENPNLPYLKWLATGDILNKSKIERLAAHLSYAPLRYDFALFTDNKDRAFAKEKKLVDYFGRSILGKGVLANIAKGGQCGHPGHGRVVSKESRLKISRALTGRSFSAVHRERISKSLKGRSMSAQVIKNMRAGKPKVIKLSPEHRMAVSKGRLASPNVKRVKVKIDGIVYSSVKEAAKQTGINYSSIYSRLRANHPKYLRLTEG